MVFLRTTRRNAIVTKVPTTRVAGAFLASSRLSISHAIKYHQKSPPLPISTLSLQARLSLQICYTDVGIVLINASKKTELGMGISMSPDWPFFTIIHQPIISSRIPPRYLGCSCGSEISSSRGSTQGRNAKTPPLCSPAGMPQSTRSCGDNTQTPGV